MAWRQLVTPNIDVYAQLGMCLNYVQRAYGSGWAGSYALDGWARNSYNHEDWNIPSGMYVPIWFQGYWNGVNYGHVAIYKDGVVYSSPWRKANAAANVHDTLGSIADVERIYRMTYIGWSEDIGGTRVIEYQEDQVVDKINRTELEWHYRLLAGREAGQDELNELMRKTDQGLGYHQLTEEMKTWFQQRGEGYYQYRDRAESQIADLKRQLEASSAALAAVNGENDKLVQDNRELLEDIAAANAKVSESEGSLAENIKMNEQAKKEADNFLTAVLNALRGMFSK